VACKPSVRFQLHPVQPAASRSASDLTFRWEEMPEPVIDRGAEGSWESVDVLNPSVLRWRNRHWNLYSGFDGKTWHTGVAWSDDDGITWTGRRKILSPQSGSWDGSAGTYIAANGSALVVGDRLFYWYQGGRDLPRIGLARSSDGESWQTEPVPVLETGPRGSWDERGVADPYVIRQGQWLYLYYTGMDRAQRQRLGVARSLDGIRWEKSLDNPILDIGGHEAWDEGGLGEPAIWESHGAYWMLYTGRAWDEKRRLGLARSTDGIHWQKLPGQVFSGASEWDAAVICDPSVEVTREGTVRVWFGGGRIARPDERIDGRIGLATLTSVPR
jgi:predicted GH43/DUF377 family glycosyl hydrolase